jgi:hypothetical protein
MNNMMKSITFIALVFILGIGPVKAAEKIDLANVPFTDVATFWTWEGKRLPVKNKNLFGNKICIGGVKYDKGIAGHTGFSIVYNLSGQALSFTAEAGIDDEAHPRDPKDMKESTVRVIVLVDRKEVFRKIVKLGEKAIPISIDLKGRQQLELRGEYATGFHKQRIAFANPVIETNNKADFLKKAEMWKDKVEAEKKVCIKYPPAPNWKKVKIEKVDYQGWKNSYMISNGKLELVITPEFGGRIMSLSLKDGKNILTPNGKFKEGYMQRGTHLPDGGHFTRFQPRNYFIPSDPVVMFGKYSVEFPVEGEILLTSQKSYYFFIQCQIRIKIKENASYLELTTTHKNIGNFSQKAGIWSITRINSSLVKGMLVPEEMKNPPRKLNLTPENYLSKLEKKDGWLEFPVSKKFLSELPKRASITWEEFPLSHEVKVLFADSYFVKKFKFDKTNYKHMKVFYPAHFYLCKKFLETECHGPTKELKPNREISLTEIWELKKLP